MNKTYLSAGIVLLTLCAIAFFNTRQQEPLSKDEKQRTANHVTSHSQPDESEARPARRRSNARPQPPLKDDVSEDADDDWLFEDPLSSSVTAKIQAGESLVTGGYKTANGNYELTIITPRIMLSKDGGEMIEIKTKIFSVAQEFVAANDLESITTDARNTFQHAEAWNSAAVTETLEATKSSEGATLST